MFHFGTIRIADLPQREKRDILCVMHLSVPKQLPALGDLLDTVARYFKEQQADSDTIFAMSLAIDEIFTNFVKHQSIGKRNVEVELTIDAGCAKAIMKDYDVDEFDFTKQKPADMDALAAVASPSGRGIYLATQLLDNIEYAYANRICTVTLTKSLRSARV